MRDRDDSKGSRWAIFCVIVAIHGALVLLALNWVVRVRTPSERSWVFLVPPNKPAQPLPASPAPVPPRKKPPARPDARAITVPAPVPPAAIEQPRAPIDWKAEVQLSVKHQEELAEGPQPRALDRHGEGIDLNGGLGPDHKRKSDFAWDRKHTNRVEVVPGAVIVRVSDHCVLAFFPFPFVFCGIGKIPVRGDLLDHMRDEPLSDANQKNIAP
ncbi:MAG TPA: hypothetical protein VGI65_05995 [Steroidobacteraceae bacterium]